MDEWMSRPSIVSRFATCVQVCGPHREPGSGRCVPETSQSKPSPHHPAMVHTRVDSWLHTRPQITQVIRRHMEDNGFLEIETPVLQVCPRV